MEQEQKKWVIHVLVVEVRDNVAEVMEHYRVVTESQGQSAQSVLPRPDNAPIPSSVPSLLSLPRPRGHMYHTNYTPTLHAQTIKSIKTLHPTNTMNSSSGTSKQPKYPGPLAQPQAPSSVKAIRQRKDIIPPRPLHDTTLSDIVEGN